MHTKTRDDGIRIKMIRDAGEREYYGDVIGRQHYLGSAQINSNTVVHVARRGREDLAILTWEAGTRHWFGLRDRIIGWTKGQKEQRFKYCVENRRFLMLVKENNLASQVITLSMKQLVEDAAKVFGHEVLLAETFVDPSKKLEGTCYKAAGWREAGMTQGGRGAQQRSPKRYFIKELKQNALAKLKALELTPSDTVNPRQSVLSLENLNIRGLKDSLDKVADYRKHKGWYPMSSILALIITAVLSGASNISEIHRWISELSPELLRSLGCRECPSYSMIRSTIINTDQGSLCKNLCEWLSAEGRRVC